MRHEKALSELLVRFALRHMVTVGLILIFGSLAGLLFSYTKEESFVSHGTAVVDSRYFATLASPAVLPEILGDVERKEAISALVRESLSREFLDILGEKHDLFPEPVDGPRHADQRERLRQQIVLVFPTTSSIRISFTSYSPGVSQEAVLDIILRIRAVMRARIAKHFQSTRALLVRELNRVAESILDDAQLDYVNRQILYLDTDLKELATEGVDGTVQAEGERKETPRANPTDNRLFEELIQKLSTLRMSVALTRAEQGFLKIVEEPSFNDTAISPRRGEFVQYGFALSLLVALMVTLHHEYRRAQFYEPSEVAEVLGVRFLGELPGPPVVEWRYLIEATKLLKNQKLLDSP